MQFKVILKNRKLGCQCNIFQTDSTKVAKKAVEAMNGAPCAPGNGCENACANCKAESIKMKG